ncbi:hypothetical protein MPH_07311 [Macrophomina phaseolina MS6]|uniref:Uncharacterized protein n=1 Tax=Macrophomina phaseolina (strain MS6) TaxID=1126212 RepID=K2RZ84_MACPH|nr:hypothetical protein MPH_07311 [Macrophomina phaseolina MS6]
MEPSKKRTRGMLLTLSPPRFSSSAFCLTCSVASAARPVSSRVSEVSSPSLLHRLGQPRRRTDAVLPGFSFLTSLLRPYGCDGEKLALVILLADLEFFFFFASLVHRISRISHTPCREMTVWQKKKKKRKRSSNRKKREPLNAGTGDKAVQAQPGYVREQLGQGLYSLSLSLFRSQVEHKRARASKRINHKG